MEQDYQYWAFISYSHADERWAKWLHKALETYTVPARLVGHAHPDGSIPKRLMPVFRDRDELPSSHELGAVINRALQQSRYLVVICSPHAAKSRWVEEEIKAFKRLGRESRVLALIVDGEPYAADAALECFPAALKVQVDTQGQLTDLPVEPIAADARPFADHKRGALLKLIAGLIGVGYDELIQRERQRRRWQRVQQVAAAVAAVALLTGVWTWFEQREAQQLAAARLDRLIQLGQQELRETRQARAAVYFTEALHSGRDTPALRYWLARAMQPVDAVAPRALALGNAVIDATLSADGQHLLTWRAGTAEWWDLAAGKRIHAIALPLQQFIGNGRITADGKRAVLSGVSAGDATGAAQQSALIDLVKGRLLATVPGSAWPGAGARFDATGARVLLSTELPSATAGGKPVNAVVVRAMEDGRALAELRGPEGTAVGSFSEDGKRILTGGEGSGEICILDAVDYRVLKRIHPRQALPHSAYWTGRGDEILSISEGGAIKLWDGASGELLDALGNHRLFAMPSEPAANRWWLTSSIDGTKVWDLETGQGVFSTEAVGNFSANTLLSSNGAQLLAPEDRLGPSLWSVVEGQREQVLDAHTAATAKLTFTTDGQQVLSVSNDGQIRWFNRAALARPLARLAHGPYLNPLERPGVTELIAEPGSKVWVSGGADATLRRWDALTGAPLATLQAHAGSITALVYAAAAKRIVAGDSSGRLLAWDGTSAAPAWVREAPEDETLKDLSAAAGSVSVAVLVSDTRVRLLDAASGEPRQLIERTDKLKAIQLIDAERLLVRKQDETVAIWQLDGSGGVREQLLGGDISPINSLAIDPSNRHLVLANTQGAMQVIDLATGTVQAQIAATDASTLDIRTLAITADGKTVAAGSFDGSLLLWHWPSQRQQPLVAHQQTINRLQFDVGGTLLASGSSSGELLLWQVDNGQLLERLGSATVPIEALRFDATDTRLASTVWLDNAIRVWDVHRETRDAVTLQRQIACAVPWQLADMKLVARKPDFAACK